MYKIMVIFAIIGVLVTLLFLFKFVLLVITAIKRNSDIDNWSIVRHQMCSDNCEGLWYIIPTIEIHRGKFNSDHTGLSNRYIEISVKFLKWEYYTNYTFSNEV